MPFGPLEVASILRSFVPKIAIIILPSISTLEFEFLYLTLIFFLLQDTDDIYSQSYIPGTLTKHKFETLGTRDAVKDTRQNYLTNQKKEQGKWHEIFTRSHARM